ncbi:MAG: hypothetical protein HY775_12165 [Acidobacteria bacterium]|nr:hypothetical protein [Acidobacteriota bacterium]
MTRAKAHSRALHALMWSALVALLLGQATMVAARDGARRPPAPVPALRASVADSDALGAIRSTMSVRLSAPPAIRRRLVAARLRAGGGRAVFGGLGAWVDLYDLGLDPWASTRIMRARGVRTLFVQTGRYNTPLPVDPRAWRWVRAAHAAGLSVVGWYLPGYVDLALDVERAVAVAAAPRGGERFDGLGIDIEWRRGAPSRGEWNRRVLRHVALVRRAVGRFPVAAITPSPLQMRVAPGYWAGFPWRGLAAASDAIMTMSYWSYRDGCPAERLYCAYEYTKEDVRLARRLTGGRVPIHVIGGVGDRVSAAEVSAFVRGARDAGAFGASLYDYGTTPSAFWRYLSALRTL